MGSERRRVDRPRSRRGKPRSHDHRSGRFWRCGTDDILIEDNRRLHHACLDLAVQHQYREFSGGHTWDYWDLHIRYALAFHLEGWGLI